MIKISDLRNSAEYFAALEDLEKHVAAYREEPGFVIRSAAVILAPSKALVNRRPSVFYIFHKSLKVWWRAETNFVVAALTDTKQPRPGSGAIILLPFGHPSMTGTDAGGVSSTVPGMLLYFYWRTHLGGHRLTREGVNFSTFRFQLTVSALPSGPSIQELADCGSMCFMAEESYREDTMWCLE